jgi:hypothetical protein
LVDKLAIAARTIFCAAGETVWADAEAADATAAVAAVCACAAPTASANAPMPKVNQLSFAISHLDHCIPGVVATQTVGILTQATTRNCITAHKAIHRVRNPGMRLTRSTTRCRDNPTHQSRTVPQTPGRSRSRRPACSACHPAAVRNQNTPSAKGKAVHPLVVFGGGWLLDACFPVGNGRPAWRTPAQSPAHPGLSPANRRCGEVAHGSRSQLDPGSMPGPVEPACRAHARKQKAPRGGAF